MNIKIFKRAVPMLLAVTMIFSIALSAATFEASAEEGQTERYSSHLINIVYDDSNSMLLDGRLWWCYAKYSLEVFSSMMQERDNMNVYYMSDFRDKKQASPTIANLSGKRSQQQANISKIHNTVTKTWGTPFASIQTAYNDLKKTGGYDEKWLVVITDGDKFDGGENETTLNNLFGDCEASGINVVYLAIGSDLVPATKKGVSVYKADGENPSGSNGILAKVTEICQKIFQRPDIKKVSNGQITLDIPVTEIVVFAQGSNVSIGDMEGTDKAVANVTMSESDKDKATTNSDYKNKVNITNLNASVVTFTPKYGSYIKEGTYALSIQADEYIVYYKPCLEVILSIYDSKHNKISDKYIPIGNYTMEYWLTYPEGHEKHGEKISQSLFDVDYTLTCTTNGDTRVLQSPSVDLTEGEVTLKVLAEYLNFSTSDASFKCIVEDFTVNDLGLELVYNQDKYLLSTLETANDGFTVKVTQNGNPIASEDWERFKLECDVEKLDFKVQKNSDSSFTVYPRYFGGDRMNTATGDISIPVKVSAYNDHRVTDIGSVTANINIYDDVSAVELGVIISDQDVECTNKNFSECDNTRKVTINWNGNNLTKEQYDALQLDVKMKDKHFIATIEKDPYVEGQPTTATVKFETVKQDDGSEPAPKHLVGKKKFDVTATVENEGQTSRGNSTGIVDVKDARTFWELLLDILPLLIALAIIVFLILAYFPGIIKNYLPKRCKYKAAGIETTVTLKPTIISVITPFRSLRCSIPVKNPKFGGCVLNVKANKGNNVICTNADQLGKSGFMLKGKVCKHSEKINLTSLPITKAGGILFAQFVKPPKKKKK